ncbi:MAG: DUF4091 domain-containing protein [Clostridia bacterium]|nr:DUF4091 domain-containing protein [Clostridia bacterium]
MKKLITLIVTFCMLAAAVITVFAADSHALTAADQAKAEALIAKAVEKAPEISNEAVKAEYEDADITLWFEHSHVKTPAEVTESNGRNSYQIRMAKNEIECVWLVLASKTDKEITLTVSDFVNGETALTPRLYYGFYFDDVEGQSVVDPIPPLDGPITLHANRSQAFLIKISTGKDAPSGQYAAFAEVKDGDGKQIKCANVYAYVWDFALPDSPHVKTQTDVGWWGIYAADPQLYSGDDGYAYKFYYDTLLENKVNAYSMPNLLDGNYGGLEGDNLETVKAYLDDPRMQSFNPLGWKTALSDDNVKAAYDFLSQNPEWLKKAYFYPDYNDEPMTLQQLKSVLDSGELLKRAWGEGYKLLIPMHWNTLLDSKTGKDHFEYVKDAVTVWCPHTFFFNTLKDQKENKKLTVRVKSKTESKLGTFPERMAKEQAEGDEVWWYVTRFPQDPELSMSISDPEVNHRLLFWQQKLYNVDGFLYYSATDWYGAGASQHNWGWNSKHEVDTGTINPFNYYGNGVLLYHGGYVGRLHECVESIRLESIRDGIEDYDYFDLLDEKYGEGSSTLIIKQITTSLGNYNPDAELLNSLRLTVGNLIAPDPEPEPADTETQTVTEPATERATEPETEAETETQAEPNKTSPAVWIVPTVLAILAVIIIPLFFIKKKK